MNRTNPRNVTAYARLAEPWLSSCRARGCRASVEVCVEVCQGLSRLTPCGSGVEVGVEVGVLEHLEHLVSRLSRLSRCRGVEAVMDAVEALCRAWAAMAWRAMVAAPSQGSVIIH